MGHNVPAKALAFTRIVLRDFFKTSGLEPRMFGDSLRVINAYPGRVEFELEIRKWHTNRLGILHGGTIASLVDLGGSLAVASRGLFATGVSTDLNVTYLSSGGRIGDTLRAVVDCDKFGKTLAYTSIKFTNGKGDICARGSHTKYVAQAWSHQFNRTTELPPISSKPESSSSNENQDAKSDAIEGQENDWLREIESSVDGIDKVESQSY